MPISFGQPSTISKSIVAGVAGRAAGLDGVGFKYWLDNNAARNIISSSPTSEANSASSATDSSVAGLTNNNFMEYLQGLLASEGQENVENRLYNAEQAQLARDFSASEAQKNRDYLTEMSNTSYQRAVADLQKAGLNPILAYSQGGASTPNSSSAQTSAASYQVGGGDSLTSVINAFANLMSSASDIMSYFMPRLSSSTSSSTSRNYNSNNSTSKNYNWHFKGK